MLYERIKAVRKALDLSQKEFGNRLGVSRDVVANIEYNRVEPQKILIQHICAKFAVNTDWLENGEGDMFISHHENLAEAIRLFDELKPDFQEYVLQQMDKLLELQKGVNTEP